MLVAIEEILLTSHYLVLSINCTFLKPFKNKKRAYQFLHGPYTLKCTSFRHRRAALLQSSRLPLLLSLLSPPALEYFHFSLPSSCLFEAAAAAARRAISRRNAGIRDENWYRSHVKSIIAAATSYEVQVSWDIAFRGAKGRTSLD